MFPESECVSAHTPANVQPDRAATVILSTMKLWEAVLSVLGVVLWLAMGIGMLFTGRGPTTRFSPSMEPSFTNQIWGAVILSGVVIWFVWQVRQRR